ncbi:MAG: transposase [Nitrosomonas sp.]|nr:transposase [Nitrosomonas sp.]
MVAEPVPPPSLTAAWQQPDCLRITTCKYLDHLPLYTPDKSPPREDVTLSLSTMAEWVGRVGVALQTLVDRLILHSLQGHCAARR